MHSTNFRICSSLVSGWNEFYEHIGCTVVVIASRNEVYNYKNVLNTYVHTYIDAAKNLDNYNRYSFLDDSEIKDLWLKKNRSNEMLCIYIK